MNLWYVLYCKSQDVEKIARRVSEWGVTAFCPKYVRLTRRNDCNAVRIDEKILFPNYLFLSFDIDTTHTSTITSIPGAIGFVRSGADAAIVPQDVISAIECARLIALNKDDSSIECRNVPPTLLEKIQKISLLSTEERQVALSRLLQSSEL